MLLAESDSDASSADLAALSLEDILREYAEDDDDAAAAASGLSEPLGGADDDDDEEEDDDDVKWVLQNLEDLEGDRALLEMILAEDEDGAGALADHEVERILVALDTDEEPPPPAAPADRAAREGGGSASLWDAPAAAVSVRPEEPARAPRPPDARHLYIHPLAAAQLSERRLVTRKAPAHLPWPLRARRRNAALARLRRRPRTAVVGRDAAAPPPGYGPGDGGGGALAGEAAAGETPGESPGEAAGAPHGEGEGEGEGALPSDFAALSPFEAVSSQLEKNAMYSSHGPGPPTALACGPSTLAVGTARALVLLFGAAEEAVRGVLGRAADAERDGPVAALAIDGAEAFLLGAFDSGRLTLWDLRRMQALRSLPGERAAPVTIAAFLPGPSGAAADGAAEATAVTVDATGKVQRVKFTRNLFGQSVSEAECLLDGAAGAIPALDALPAGGGGAGPGGEGLLAFSSEEASFVAAVGQRVKVLHRWPRPAAADAAGAAPCLRWAWIDAEAVDGVSEGEAEGEAEGGDGESEDGGDQSDQEGEEGGDQEGDEGTPPGAAPPSAVLARAWGRCIELLQVLPAPPAAPPAAEEAAAGSEGDPPPPPPPSASAWSSAAASP